MQINLDRCRIYTIWPNDILFLLNWPTDKSKVWAIPEIENIPKDATIVSVFPDPERRSISVVVYHESFEIVADGDVIPRFETLTMKARAIDIIRDTAIDVSGWSLDDLKSLRDRVNERIFDIERA